MKDIKKDILWRVYLVYFGVLVFAMAIIGKAAYIQFALKDELMEKAKKQEIKYFPIEALRGNIMARDGSLLASSIPEFEIRMDLSPEVVIPELFNSKIDSLSMMLSQLFEDKNARAYKSELLNARQAGNKYYLIRNHVKYYELKKLKKFPIFREGKYSGGLIVLRKTTRELPYKDLARRTIGFENPVESLYVGLEGAYSNELKGYDGQQLKRRISQGEWIPVSDNPEVEPRDGKDIITTIDINIQDLAESALARHLEENQAFQGCAILMEVKTGEIRAIANLRYDAKDGQYKETYNYSIGEAVEPGSTFKLASLITALETGQVKLSDYYYVGNGRVQYHNRWMEDSHRPDSSYMSVREIFEQSSNVGVSKIITSLFGNKPELYVDHLRKMSLGKPLGIEIPGEGDPYIKDPKDSKYWYGTSLPWMSIGYELTITPLQLLTFYNAIANNGVMVKPLFVSEIREGGQTIKKFDPVVINPAVCTPVTLQLVRSLLEGVVMNGTGKILKDSTYKIAGKTGTALIAEGSKGYTQKKYNASFVGYFPADNPKYSCIIVVNRPEAGKYYGAAVAAPVFKEIANKVYATQLDIHDQDDKKYFTEKFLPAAARGDYKDLRTSLSAMSYAVRLPSQNPEWVAMDSSTTVMLLQPTFFGSDTIPDLTGLTAKDAVYMMEKAGISSVIHGKGIVFSQSLPAGTPLVKGSEIILTLENPIR
ncbi:MAG: transpeptidase family protein [Bacteroidales bacterium]|nr:transpeptidase family protein [Bacteroidales bacterium]